jgi:hypothetical protein
MSLEELKSHLDSNLHLVRFRPDAGSTHRFETLRLGGMNCE